MLIMEYVAKYGNFRTQLVKEVYHRCGLCQEELLLDGDALHKHTMRHKMMMRDYTAKYIRNKDGRPRTFRALEADHVSRPARAEEKTPEKGKPQPTAKKATKGVWETMQDIENILDSFTRSYR